MPFAISIAKGQNGKVHTFLSHGYFLVLLRNIVISIIGKADCSEIIFWEDYHLNYLNTVTKYVMK